jgi:hypothetical protein
MHRADQCRPDQCIGQTIDADQTNASGRPPRPPRPMHRADHPDQRSGCQCSICNDLPSWTSVQLGSFGMWLVPYVSDGRLASAADSGKVGHALDISCKLAVLPIPLFCLSYVLAAVVFAVCCAVACMVGTLSVITGGRSKRATRYAQVAGMTPAKTH